MKSAHRLAITAILMAMFSGHTWARSGGYDLVQDVPSPDTKIEIEEGQDKVYRAVKEGELQPFSKLYATVESQLHGQVIRVELEKKRWGWLYELKLLAGEQVFEAKFDGTTLELLELEGRDLYSLIKHPQSTTTP